MASLIWESAGYISTGNVKLRVKMNDDSNMADSDEGISFMQTINGTSWRQVAFEEFWWSLGFGVENYNYDEFWNTASTSDYWNSDDGYWPIEQKGVSCNSNEKIMEMWFNE